MEVKKMIRKFQSLFFIFLVLFASTAFAVQDSVQSGGGSSDGTTNVIEVTVPSTFSLNEGQSAYITNYMGISIKLKNVLDENSVTITAYILTGDNVYKIIDYTIKKRKTVNIPPIEENLSITLNEVNYNGVRGNAASNSANFQISINSKKEKEIFIEVPSYFSLTEGKTAYVVNYRDMKIKMLGISEGNETFCVGIGKCSVQENNLSDMTGHSRPEDNARKQYIVSLLISSPGGCGSNVDPNAVPRCLGAPAFSMNYDIAAGQTVQVLGLKLTFTSLSYKQPDIPNVGTIPRPSNSWEKVANFEIEISDETRCPEGCVCKEDFVVCTARVTPIQTAEATSITPEQIVIAQSTNGRISITKGEASAHTTNKIAVEDKQLVMETSKGNKTIKVMPDTASQVAINQLKLKNYEIELKDVGKPVYEVRGTQEVKIFGFIKTTMEVSSQIDAESGNVISTKRPWWSFLTR